MNSLMRKIVLTIACAGLPAVFAGSVLAQERKSEFLPSVLPTVYVVGSVRNPQGLMWFEGMTVSQAIAAAGGTLPDANMERVRVYSLVPDDGTQVRSLINFQLIKKRPDLDRMLHPSDIVEVLSRHISDPMGWERFWNSAKTFSMCVWKVIRVS